MNCYYLMSQLLNQYNKRQCERCVVAFSSPSTTILASDSILQAKADGLLLAQSAIVVVAGSKAVNFELIRSLIATFF